MIGAKATESAQAFPATFGWEESCFASNIYSFGKRSCKPVSREGERQVGQQIHEKRIYSEEICKIFIKSTYFLLQDKKNSV